MEEKQPPDLLKKQAASAARARAARVENGTARKLRPPAERLRLFFFWMHQWHSTTKGIVVHMGLTTGDVQKLASDGLITFKQSLFRPTARAKPRPISVLSLTDKGKKAKTKSLGYQEECPRLSEYSMSHDLCLQAWIAELVRKNEIQKFIGSAQIRNGALKNLGEANRFGFWNIGVHGVDWKFDAVLMGLNETYVAIELERTRKSKPEDLQKFFQKLHTNGPDNTPIMILAETPQSAETWKKRLADWRQYGEPIGLKNGQYQFDSRIKLNDHGRTSVISFDSVLIEKILASSRNPAGQKGRARSSEAPSWKAVEDQLNKSGIAYDQAKIEDRLAEVLSCLQQKQDERPSMSRSEFEKPEVELARHLPSGGPYFFLTLDEAKEMIRGDGKFEPEKLADSLFWRHEHLPRLLRQAANQPAQPPSPAPLKPKGLKRLFGA